MGTQTKILLGWPFGHVSRVIIPDRNKGHKVLAYVAYCLWQVKCWGHECTPLVLFSWKPLATPEFLLKRIEAAWKLYPPSIAGCLKLLKLRKEKLAKSQRKSYTSPVWFSFSAELVKPGWQVPLCKEWVLLVLKDNMSNQQCRQSRSPPYSTLSHIPLLFCLIVLSLAYIFQSS